MDFKRVTLSDYALCMKMMKDFYTIDNYPFSELKARKCFEEIIRNDHLGRFWLLYRNRLPIGYIILTFGFSFEYGGKDAFIDEFYLIPGERRKGFGSMTLEKLKEKAKQLDIKAIHLEVEKTNQVGNRLYRQVGFEGNNRSLLTQKID
ncbi:GNAT family N-acetyltransferase [Ekhidna sp.]|uniref:GNAT family N-acetyltransferase n=1 Tax=Ekhidna sp. TaxID=2608089 RepID=UPI0032EBF14A